MGENLGKAVATTVATTIDTSKPVWKVIGRLREPDGRGYICFVNATSKAEAVELARAEGMATFEDTWEIDTATGLRKNKEAKPNEAKNALMELSTRELEEELRRRESLLTINRCDYCGHKQGSDPACKFPARYVGLEAFGITFEDSPPPLAGLDDMPPAGRPPRRPWWKRLFDRV